MATSVDLPPGFEFEDEVPSGFEFEDPAPKRNFKDVLRMAAMTAPVGQFAPRTPEEVRDVPGVVAAIADAPAFGVGHLLAQTPLSGVIGQGAKLSVAGGRTSEPAVTLPSVQTPFGQRTALVGGTALAAAIPGVAAAQGMGDVVNNIATFPQRRSAEIRKAIPAFIRSGSRQYGAALNQLIKKTGGQVPVDEMATLLTRYAENPDVMGTVDPHVGTALTNALKNLRAHTGENVDAREIIRLRQGLRKLLPRGRGFDVSAHVINNVTKDLGSALEPYVPGLRALNARYGEFFKTKEFGVKVFEPFKNEYLASRGTRTLGRILHQPPEMQRGLTALEQALPVKPFVTKAKVRATPGFVLSKLPVLRRFL